MRLIDADELKKCLCKKDADYDKPVISPKFLEDYIDDMIVNQTPTYNVDKVVEDLLQCTYCNGHKDHEKQCGGCAGCLECKLEDAYYKAIEIVKRGGKDV